MNIFGGLVTQLRSVIVLTNANIMDLRWYISNRYSDMSPKEAAKIFADAVNKIIDKNIPEIGEPFKAADQDYSFENAIKKPEFEINCADVFKVCLKERSFPTSGFRALSIWIKQCTNELISEDQLKDLYEGIQTMLPNHPNDDIGDIIKAFENRNDSYNPFSKMQVPLDNYSESYGSNQSKNNYGYGSYNESKKSKSTDVELTYVNYNEFKPIYSFDNSTSMNNDRSSKKRLSTFMKKVTMRKMVTISATAAAAFIFAKSAGYTTDVSDGLSNIKPLERDFQPMSSDDTKYVGNTMNLVLQTYKTVDSKVEMPTTDQQKKEVQVVKVSTPVVEKTAISSNQYIANSIKSINAKATSYTLSVASCGKERTHPEYGITFSGTRAKAGRTIAVDPKVIPIGSQVYIVFPKAYSHLDGVYIAEDTGRLIKGNIVDIFLGEDQPGSEKVENVCNRFGRQDVQLYLLKDKVNLSKLT